MHWWLKIKLLIINFNVLFTMLQKLNSKKFSWITSLSKSKNSTKLKSIQPIILWMVPAWKLTLNEWITIFFGYPVQKPSMKCTILFPLLYTLLIYLETILLYSLTTSFCICQIHLHYNNHYFLNNLVYHSPFFPMSCTR